MILSFKLSPLPFPLHSRYVTDLNPYCRNNVAFHQLCTLHLHRKPLWLMFLTKDTIKMMRPPALRSDASSTNIPSRIQCRLVVDLERLFDLRRETHPRDPRALAEGKKGGPPLGPPFIPGHWSSIRGGVPPTNIFGKFELFFPRRAAFG